MEAIETVARNTSPCRLTPSLCVSWNIVLPNTGRFSTVSFLSVAVCSGLLPKETTE